MKDVIYFTETVLEFEQDEFIPLYLMTNKAKTVENSSLNVLILMFENEFSHIFYSFLRENIFS